MEKKKENKGGKGKSEKMIKNEESEKGWQKGRKEEKKKK